MSSQETDPAARYVLVGPIGEGGMATVFDATDTNLDRPVAVKVLREEPAAEDRTRQRFFDEAEVMASVDHPGVLPVLEKGRLPDGRFFYSMAKVRGRTMAALIEEAHEQGSAPVSHRLLSVFNRICETMAYAHAKGIVHRDLKPENVMVDDFGTVYVIDWGIAKRLDSDAALTQEGAIMGTPSYMSPELASGSAHIADCETDVFALGVILYEVLTGAKPFERESARKTMKEVLYKDPETPRRVNPRVRRELSAICMKALSKDPKRRYPTARELAVDIRNFQEHLPTSAIRPRLADRLRNWSERHPRWSSALSVLAAALVVATLVYGFQFISDQLVLDEGWERFEELEAEIAAARVEMADLESQLEAAPEGSTERAELSVRLEQVEATYDLDQFEKAVLLRGMLGLMMLSPDERLVAELRRNIVEVIEDGLEDGDYQFVKAFVSSRLEMTRADEALGLSEEDVEYLRAAEARAEEGIARRLSEALQER